eukprot:COSAG02_NODE_30_length_50867_cov_66.594331_54_plen_51_part_01
MLMQQADGAPRGSESSARAATDLDGAEKCALRLFRRLELTAAPTNHNTKQN